MTTRGDAAGAAPKTRATLLLLVGCASLALVSCQAAGRSREAPNDSPQFRICMAAAETQSDSDNQRHTAGANSALATIAELYFIENECLRVSNLPYVSRSEILQRRSVICCPVRVLRGAELDKALRLIKTFG